MSISATDEVKSSRSAELEDGISSVGKEARLRGVTSFVLVFRHLHHRILLVPETLFQKQNTDTMPMRRNGNQFIFKMNATYGRHHQL